MTDREISITKEVKTEIDVSFEIPEIIRLDTEEMSCLATELAGFSANCDGIRCDHCAFKGENLKTILEAKNLF